MIMKKNNYSMTVMMWYRGKGFEEELSHQSEHPFPSISGKAIKFYVPWFSQLPKLIVELVIFEDVSFPQVYMTL